MDPRGGLAARTIERALRTMRVFQPAAAPPSSSDPVACFGAAAVSLPAISADEESELCSVIPPRPGVEEETAAGSASARPDADAIAAEHRLVMSSLRLVRAIVGRFVPHHPSLHADMLQEGVLGLYSALRRFELERGTRFITYAAWWVFQRVGQLTATMSLAAQLPKHLHEISIRLHRSRTAAELTHPVVEKDAVFDAALEFDLPRPIAATLLALAEGPIPLDTSEVDAASRPWLVDTRERDPSQAAVEGCSRETVNECLADLDSRSRDVVIWRFGFADSDELTLDEIGMRLGLTRERVRQLEERALDRLRRGRRRRLLASLLDAPDDDLE